MYGGITECAYGLIRVLGSSYYLIWIAVTMNVFFSHWFLIVSICIVAVSIIFIKIAIIWYYQFHLQANWGWLQIFKTFKNVYLWLTSFMIIIWNFFQNNKSHLRKQHLKQFLQLNISFSTTNLTWLSIYSLF